MTERRRNVRAEVAALEAGSEFLDRCETAGNLPEGTLYGPGQVSVAVAAMQGTAVKAK